MSTGLWETGNPDCLVNESKNCFDKLDFSEKQTVLPEIVDSIAPVSFDSKVTIGKVEVSKQK